MTRPAANKNPAAFTLAMRAECDCWEALTKHTAGCPPCLAARQIHGINGFGCEAGLAARGKWLTAAKLRYELSPKSEAAQAMIRLKKQQEAEACE